MPSIFRRAGPCARSGSRSPLSRLRTTATLDLEIVREICDRVLMFCEDHEISVDGAPDDVLTDTARLIECNLLHEHRHHHGEMEHSHPHTHRSEHTHAS